MKVTTSHFNQFKREFNRWVEAFGLKEYEVAFNQTTLARSVAEVHINEPNKLVTLYLAEELSGLDADIFDPKEMAKHEAIHLLLHRLVFIGESRYIDESEINHEWERLVRILEKVL